MRLRHRRHKLVKIAFGLSGTAIPWAARRLTW
jgi:hypothetical protein